MSTTGADWYSLDHLPPGRVRVRLRWGAFVLIAARIAHPKTKRPAWAVLERGEAVFLPRPRDRDRWPPEPHSWQPETPAAWTWPGGVAPEPLAEEVQPRLWSSTMRFASVDDAEAADLAREMERDREDAGSAGASGRLPAGESEAPERQWWLDPHAVTYSAPGAITPREAEGRLMRAFATERWVRVERPGLPTFAAALSRQAATVPLSPAELAIQDPLPERDEPTGRDQDDMLVALSWLQALTSAFAMSREGLRIRRKGWRVDGDLDLVLRFRSETPALSWRRIGKRLDVTHTTAKRDYEEALRLVTMAANGVPTDGMTQARAALDAVRAANRAHRRGGA